MHQLEINAPYCFDWLVIASEALNELLFRATNELFLPHQALIHIVFRMHTDIAITLSKWQNRFKATLFNSVLC
jgi:hypothetical protein